MRRTLETCRSSQQQIIPFCCQKSTHLHFTVLVIQDIHQKLQHVGTSHTLSHLRRKYWIPRGRQVVKTVLSQCLKCRRYHGPAFRMPHSPDLPPERVTRSPPFAYTTVDYFGPLLYGQRTGRKEWSAPPYARQPAPPPPPTESASYGAKNAKPTRRDAPFPTLGYPPEKVQRHHLEIISVRTDCSMEFPPSLHRESGTCIKGPARLQNTGV